jgi:hypothetical protein
MPLAVTKNERTLLAAVVCLLVLGLGLWLLL